MPTMVPAYNKDEKVLCFHHELLYEAKILGSRPVDSSDKRSPLEYLVHYKGWKNTWDDWVPQDRLRKFTEENKELAVALRKELEMQRKQSTSQGKKTPASSKKRTVASARAGSDMSSIQGSEEHQSTQAATSARGQKRGRDNEIEKVRTHFSSAADRTFPLSATLKYAYGISKRPKTDHLDRHEEKRAHRKECALICVDVDTLAARRRTKRKRGEGDALRPLPKTSMPPLVPEDENEARGFWEEIEEQAMRPPTKRPRRAHLKRGKYKDGEDEASSRAKTVAGGRPSGPMSNSRRGAAGRNITSSSADPVIGTKSRGKGKGKQVETTHQPMPSQEAGANMAKKFGPSGPELTQTRDQEETFMARPSVQLVFPDHIKSILVDDWEYVTKNLQLVHLPCEYTVNRVLDDYYAHEKDQRRPGSAEADILEEFNSGMRDYFDKCLGKILLYRFERDQFYEVRDWWEGSSAAEHENIKGPADVYGAEHLARLFVVMPELIGQTNMDLQAVRRLREELVRVMQWLARRSAKYFIADYHHPTQEYIDKARGS